MCEGELLLLLQLLQLQESEAQGKERKAIKPEDIARVIVTLTVGECVIKIQVISTFLFTD